jgi:2-keto-4-pentenoate hydratase/2-oxohepta-3-ene-1,7-dioic acid hydratase in catechol pathway
MRLASYRGPDGAPRTAAVVGDEGDERIVDLFDASGGRVPAGDLLSLLEAGPEALDAARSASARASASRPLDSIQLLAPMARPPKILAAAGNYQAHIVEGGAQPVDKTVIVPKLFMKPSSAVIAPGAPVPISTVSNTLDWELELAVVIGRRGRDIPVERALDYVAGYTVINDISARTAEWGVAGRSPGEWDLFFDWLNGKWGDGYAPMGPWLVTTDEIPDPQALRMRLDVNGKTFQDAVTADMIFSSAELIAFASRFMTLEPGDTFATGTPSGVGDSTGTYLKEGDVMEGWIEKIGTLITPVTAPVRATAAV